VGAGRLTVGVAKTPASIRGVVLTAGAARPAGFEVDTGPPIRSSKSSGGEG